MESRIFRDDLLAGKVALITGGASGIGYGIATELARYGAHVAIAARNEDRMNAAAQELETFAGRVETFPVNVRDQGSVKELIGKVQEAFGRLDLLVNNAAGNFYARSAELSPNGWRAVVETDLYGTFFSSQAAYPLLKESKGAIISISMTLHYRGWPMMAHATAAKAGIDALTRTLALEWAPDGIRVNAVAPGPIPTEGAMKAFKASRAGDSVRSIDEEMSLLVPLGHWGSPDDIGNMCVYLASPAGNWITGAIFVIDGGSWMHRM